MLKSWTLAEAVSGLGAKIRDLKINESASHLRHLAGEPSQKECEALFKTVILDKESIIAPSLDISQMRNQDYNEA